MSPESPMAPHILTVQLYGDEKTEFEQYKKIGEKEGSNLGGWYEKGTGDLFYFKLYENPDNAHIEHIASQIYRKLGIRAAISELFVSNGAVWVASKKIGRGVRASKEEQQRDFEFRRGFVADAYLCNWDVVGEYFDNIVKDEEGHLYRIDNGGCGPLRASGKSKAFPANHIRELDEMRDPQFEAGQVFGGVSEEDILVQAKHLVASLDSLFLENLCRMSGLSEDPQNVMLEGLLGRKAYLESMYS